MAKEVTLKLTQRQYEVLPNLIEWALQTGWAPHLTAVLLPLLRRLWKLKSFQEEKDSMEKKKNWKIIYIGDNKDEVVGNVVSKSEGKRRIAQHAGKKRDTEDYFMTRIPEVEGDAYFLEHVCKRTCVGGSERGTCECKNPLECKAKDLPGFKKAQLDAVQRLKAYYGITSSEPHTIAEGPLSSKKIRMFLDSLSVMQQEKEEYARDLNRHSGGRTHHQGCPIGGLAIVGSADVSGAPCWCGAEQVVEEQRREGEG